MSYRPGELNERVTIQRQQTTSDGAGGHILSWADVKTVWARVRPKSGAENDDFNRVNATALAVFIVRYRSDLKASDRFVWRGVPYNIRFIPPVTPRALYLAVEAEAGVAQ
nr:hypothetical protein 24 [bacterium]